MANLLRFLVRSEASDKGAQAFETLLQSLGEDLAVKREQPESLPQDKRKVIDPISLAALILSIPSAALAVWDLADRMRKRQRAEQLVDGAKRLLRERKVEVYLVTDIGPKPLNEMTPDQVLDLAKLMAQSSET